MTSWPTTMIAVMIAEVAMYFDICPLVHAAL